MGYKLGNLLYTLLILLDPVRFLFPHLNCIPQGRRINRDIKNTGTVLILQQAIHFYSVCGIYGNKSATQLLPAAHCRLEKRRLRLCVARNVRVGGSRT